MRTTPILLSILAALLGDHRGAAQDSIYELDATLLPATAGTRIRSTADADGDGCRDFTVGGGASLALISGAKGTVLERYSSRSEFPLLLVDLDGDGIMEFVSSTAFYSAGSVFVRRGGPAGALLYTLSPPAGSVSFGTAVSAVGDLDGDGVRDLAVSTPLDTVLTSGGAILSVGKVYTYSGADGAALGVYEPGSLCLDFGTSLAAMPDLSGDGVPDLAIGSRGRAFLFSGADQRLLRELGSADVAARFGTALADAGDLDGDGRHDVIVGAPYGTYATPHGYVQVFSGGSGEVLLTLAGSRDDFFGSAVAGIEDLDGDGTRDVLVGAPQRLFVWSVNAGPGYVTAFSGKSGSALFTVRGAHAGEGFGTAVASAGDVNGDGVCDLAAARGDLSGAGIDPPSVRVISGGPLALRADAHLVGLSAGGVQHLDLAFGAAHGGGAYLVLGTLSGSTPGIELPGAHLPLNVDAWFLHTLAHPNSGILRGTLGVLDPGGRATASIAVPPLGALELDGLHLKHAAALLDGASIRSASAAVPLTLVR